MKDFIVLIATILLGVILAGFVLGFQNSAKTINKKATDGITKAFEGVSRTELCLS